METSPRILSSTWRSLSAACLPRVALIAAFSPSSSEAWTHEPAGDPASGDEQRQRAVGREVCCVFSLNHPRCRPEHVSPSIAIPVATEGTTCLMRQTRGAHGATVRDSSPVHHFPQNHLCINDLRWCKIRQ